MNLKPISANFKKILFALCVALMGAQTAYANLICGGKTVHVQLPSGWGSTVLVYTGGKWPATSGTTSGSWYTFNLPDNGETYNSTEFALVKSKDNWTSSGWMCTGTYNGGQCGTDTDKGQTPAFSCSDFGSSNDLYISEDPDNPGKIIWGTQPPNAKYFYFLPPADPKLIVATPWYYDFSTGALTKMGVDPDRCGWFRLVFTDKHPLNTNPGLILLSPRNTSATKIKDILPKDIMGELGLEEDKDDWECGDSNDETTCYPSKRFNLNNLFNDKFAGSPTIFFAPENGAAGWTSLDPNITDKDKSNERCNYKMAAIIYKSHSSKNCAFSQYGGSGGCNGNTGDGASPMPVRGLVEDRLSSDRKMVASSSIKTNNGGGWGNETNFNNAFRFSPDSNVQVCYDMPFERVANGNWEFDSDRMRNPNDKLVGGFFPHVLYSPYIERFLVGGEDYIEGNGRCTACLNNLEGIDCSPNINVPSGLSVTYKGTTYTGIDAFDRTDPFSLGIVNGSYGGSVIGNNDGNSCHPAPVNNPQATGRNQICFESHAEFTYEGGEEFFFRGDDDIWVFINNRLVIDLGGNHRAIPGYVDLDTLGFGSGSKHQKLVKGDVYNLDIFFCDRRGTEANTRVSTSIYFSQKNELTLKKGSDGKIDLGKVNEVCYETGGSGSCAAVAGTGEKTSLCGKNIAKFVRYYMTNRAGTTTIDLSEDNTENCKLDGSGDKLTCYGGINLYLSSGQVQVDTKSVVGLSGTWIVYMDFVRDANGKAIAAEDGTKPPDGADDATPAEITRFTMKSNIRLAWGNLKNSDTQTPINIPGGIKLTGNPVATVAGKPVAVAFAAGAWNAGCSKDDLSKCTTFDVNIDEGKDVKFQVTGLSGYKAGTDVLLTESGLRAFKTADANEEDEVNLREPLTIPSTGYLVLWITGNFEAEEDALYAVNAQSSQDPALQLTVYQPRMRFVTDDGTIIPKDDAKYSAVTDEKNGTPVKAGDFKDRWVWLGEEVVRHIKAFDPSKAPNEEFYSTSWEDCDKYCELKLRTKAEGTFIDPNRNEKDNRLITANGKTLNMKDGVAKISFMGATPVENEDIAILSVFGQSDLGKSAAVWDSLQFREPPVPYPVQVEIFDANGDGKGDSIKIVFNKPFNEIEEDEKSPDFGKAKDDYPNFLQIEWEEDNVIGYGLPEVKPDEDGVNEGRYTNKIFKDGVRTMADNKAYWDKFLQADGKTMIITSKTQPAAYTDTVFGQFSAKVKTAGDGVITSWSSFEDAGQEYHLGMMRPIDDKIPAIVIAAEYVGEDRNRRNCGGSQSGACNDEVRLTLSEPVMVDSTLTAAVSADDEKRAFSYKLRSASKPDFQPNSSALNPSFIVWKGSNGRIPSPHGDTIVTFSFKYYRSGSDTAFTPFPGDSVRFLPSNSDVSFLTDLLGNKPNPKEIGAEIEGKKPLLIDKIAIAELDPSQDQLKDALEDLFKDIPDALEKIKDMFTDERPVELLPVKPDWDLDSLRKYYPASVGVYYPPDVYNTLREYLGQYEGYKDGFDVGDIAKYVTFYAKSVYHTNLGNYVAKSNPGTRNYKRGESAIAIKCDDPLFKLGGGSNCMEGIEESLKASGVYVAWDLKDSKGRWVGTGAYVQMYDVWWKLDLPKEKGIKAKEFDKRSKIEMFGVKRVKKR